MQTPEIWFGNVDLFSSCDFILEGKEAKNGEVRQGVIYLWDSKRHYSPIVVNSTIADGHRSWVSFDIRDFNTTADFQYYLGPRILGESPEQVLTAMVHGNVTFRFDRFKRQFEAFDELGIGYLAKNVTDPDRSYQYEVASKDIQRRIDRTKAILKRS